jgi:hypothetical protein
MANFDLAIGADFTAYNSMFSPLLGCLQSVFPKQYDWPPDGITTSVTINSTQPPTLSLSGQTVNITFSNLSLTLGLQFGPTSLKSATVAASLTAPVVIEPTNSNTLTVSCGMCTLTASTYPDDPTAVINAEIQLVATELSYSLRDDLNTFLSAISIPLIAFGTMNFEPTFEVGPPPSNDTYLMIYGALSQPVQLPSAGTAWPPSTWFAAFDAAALSAAIAGIPLIVTGYWSHSVFSCSYSATPSILNLTGSGNQFSASFGFSGNAHFTYHDPTPLDDNQTYGPFQFSGTVDVSIALTVQNTGSIIVALSNANVSSLSAIGASGFFLVGLPLGEVYDAIKGRIASAINGTQLNYNGFTSTSFSVAGSAVTIAPQDVVLNTITGPDNVPLSILEFSLTASVDPSAPGT